jgi:N-acetylmuramoyl-L-alanine amidase
VTKKIIILVSTFVFLLSLLSFSPLNPAKNSLSRIVIDAGHGGDDPGCRGSFSREKDVALNVATQLKSILAEYMPEVKVILTRPDDKFITLNKRARIANTENADLFISIHCNSEPKKRAHGTETWVMGVEKFDKNLEEVVVRENSVILMEDNYKEEYEGFDPRSPESYILFSLYQNAFINSSLNLAGKIEDQFQNRVQRNSRGVKQAGWLVLWKTSMPSVLVELGFLTHKNEERYLNDELGQSYLASGIFRAVRDYKAELEEKN